MIQIGQYHTLKIREQVEEGFYLENEEGHDVLMPSRFIRPEMAIGDEVEVFVYPDSDDIDVATTEKPYFTLGQYAFLEVKDVNKVGAFCDWGLEKELFIPFRNQKYDLRRGDFVVVYLYVDEMTDRLVGTTKVRHLLKPKADENIKKGQEVDLLVYGISDLGYNVVIDHTYSGLLFRSDVLKPLRIGQQLTGYVKPIRPDGKINISLKPIGHLSIEPSAAALLEKLNHAGGFLPYHDKSDPEDIKQAFGMSKKLFKKSIGSLYRQKLILIEADGIRLI